MKKKFELKESEKQRILSLHESLKEKKPLLNEDAKPTKIYKLTSGYHFRVADPFVLNQNISSGKVFKQPKASKPGPTAWAYTDDWPFEVNQPLVFVCKPINNPDNFLAKELTHFWEPRWPGIFNDYDPEKKGTYSGSKLLYYNKDLGEKLKKQFCQTTSKPKNQNLFGTSNGSKKLRRSDSGNRFTFDFNSVMKAIEKTGKCSKVTPDVETTTDMTTQMVIPKPNNTTSMEDFIEWTAD